MPIIYELLSKRKIPKSSFRQQYFCTFVFKGLPEQARRFRPWQLEWFPIISIERGYLSNLLDFKEVHSLYSNLHNKSLITRILIDLLL